MRRTRCAASWTICGGGWRGWKVCGPRRRRMPRRRRRWMRPPPCLRAIRPSPPPLGRTRRNPCRSRHWRGCVRRGKTRLCRRMKGSRKPLPHRRNRIFRRPLRVNIRKARRGRAGMRCRKRAGRMLPRSKVCNTVFRRPLRLRVKRLRCPTARVLPQPPQPLFRKVFRRPPSRKRAGRMQVCNAVFRRPLPRAGRLKTCPPRRRMPETRFGRGLCAAIRC